ncbi:MAG TPA: enolase C-terminal domain-like protein [Casimicrobiaceae bacterium]|nr:enolase C-terminal domain-like protein [Casimicrobiaceae bacterium]
MRSATVPIEAVKASAYTIPTDAPESDGTLEWNSTTLVLVEASAGGMSGIGYSYADRATCTLIADRLAGVVAGGDAMNVVANWEAMVRSIRNLGRPGIASMAIAAVDNALWDLKSRLLDLPLARLLGAVRDRVPVYGSGGFTSYTPQRLAEQLASWTGEGISRVKMKVGRDPDQDIERVGVARDAIGPEAELFVDANGAYSRTEALDFAESFAELDVSWFEEPVTSDDLEGLRLIRDRAPSSIDISAGEYGYDQVYFRRMCAAGAVDVLQADATRCAGITGFMRAAALADAFLLPLSSHCAPSIHAHPCCAAPRVRHLEYFHDHVRIEHMLFDGVLDPVQGDLKPALDRPGFGLTFKHADARRYAV